MPHSCSQRLETVVYIFWFALEAGVRIGLWSCSIHCTRTCSKDCVMPIGGTGRSLGLCYLQSAVKCDVLNMKNNINICFRI